MAQFALLLHDRPQDFGVISAEEIESVVGEYMAWREKVAAQGRLIGGEKLADEGGRHLSQVEGQMRVVDGPFAEAKEHIAGFYIIQAADLDAALAWASKVTTCIGKPIEVRPFWGLQGS